MFSVPLLSVAASHRIAIWMSIVSAGLDKNGRLCPQNAPTNGSGEGPRGRFRSNLPGEFLKFFLVGFEFLGLLPHPQNFNGLDGVSPRDAVSHVLAFHHVAEDRMTIVQPGRGFVGDEDLAAFAAGSVVGYRCGS